LSEPEIIVSTANIIPGRKINKVHGPVYASIMRVLKTPFKTITTATTDVLKRLSEDINKACEEVLNEIKSKARSMGANAILGLSFNITFVNTSTFVVLASGTAVSLETIPTMPTPTPIPTPQAPISPLMRPPQPAPTPGFRIPQPMPPTQRPPVPAQPKPTSTKGQVKCPYCGRPAVYNSFYRRWYCPYCKRWI